MQVRRGPATVTEIARCTHHVQPLAAKAGKAQRESLGSQETYSDPKRHLPSRKGVVLRKRAIAAALSVLGVALIWSTGAQAALTELTVRIEGAQKTLFEGPIETDGHQIEAASDTEPRPCDATNNGAHSEPGPTPTAASVDAMELIGEGFDGDWYPGYDDYFIQQWGPDREDAGAAAYWGILVNGVFTPVGGCQYLAAAGDEVFWAYDAFTGRQMLWLSASGDLTFPASPTASVEVGEPLALTVEAGDQPSPTPAAAVTIAPVATAAGSGYQSVETASAAAVTTDAEGHASVTFSTPGWHRIKAQKEAGFIRSNRLDVCVEAVGGGGCGPLPADAQVRVAPRYAEPPEEEDGGKETPPPGGAGNPPPPAGAAAKPSNAIALGKLRLNKAKGTALLKVALPGAGQLVAKGAKVLTREASAGAAKTVGVVVKPTAKARGELIRTGRLQVTLALTFTPAGGDPGLRRRSLVLKLRPASR